MRVHRLPPFEYPKVLFAPLKELLVLAVPLIVHTGLQSINDN